MDNITDKTASTLLGKRISGSEEYNSSLLVAVPRFENRVRYEIDNENLPFEGFDVWHAYEFSVMTENSLPVTRVMKIRYNCSSPFIVESKSLKLYLNSFNMSRFGADTGECLTICKSLIEKDLSKVLQTEVEVEFLSNDVKRVEIFSDFKNIMDFVDESEIKITQFKEAPELLTVKQGEKLSEYYLMFDSLRSNCRVTHQPDFGDVFIYYKSAKLIDYASLIKYLVSFRSEYHFHEECCEMIYKRLKDILDKDDELFVCALYTRRGGIDICPARWSLGVNVEDVKFLISLTTFARCGIKQ